MRINPFFIPLLTISALLGTVAFAQWQGQWSVSGREAVDLQTLAPADIKGWMTLQQVIDGCSISQAELYALMQIPDEISPATALKDLEPIVTGFEISVLRERLADWQTGGPAPTASEPSPTPTPATSETNPDPTTLPTPAVTSVPPATPLPAVHTGDGSGTGPTPLPPGQILPADQIKGRMTLAEVSGQCGVPLDQLLIALKLSPQTDSNLQIKTLINQGLLADVSAVQAAVAALQP